MQSIESFNEHDKTSKVFAEDEENTTVVPRKSKKNKAMSYEKPESRFNKTTFNAQADNRSDLIINDEKHLEVVN